MKNLILLICMSFCTDGFFLKLSKANVSSNNSITINSGSNWSSIGTTDSHFGYVVRTAGDVNNDGYDDIAVGAYGYQNNRGKVSLFLGSPTGPSLLPSWEKNGESVGDFFGVSISSGDMNNDGYDDLL